MLWDSKENTKGYGIIGQNCIGDYYNRIEYDKIGQKMIKYNSIG